MRGAEKENFSAPRVFDGDHRRTSNLYPIPHTVAKDQLAWSLIFSRSRLI